MSILDIKSCRVETLNNCTDSELDSHEQQELLKPENSWEEIPVPKGYAVNNKGVFKKQWNPATGQYDHICICYTPVAISSAGLDIDRGEFWYEITFKDALGKVRTERATMEELINKTKIRKFANKGLNIVDRKARDLCEYFNESIDKCATDIPRKIFVQTNGWRNCPEDFVLGNRCYNGSQITEVIQINQEETKGLVKRGSLEKWVQGVEGVICETITRFKCYCAATSILLRPLNVPSFFVDHTGDTSTGKTFGVRVAFSMYGNPDELKLSADSTNTYMENVASIFKDLPLFADETSTQTEENLKTLVYIIANEVGKGRGKKEGGIQSLNRWKTVAFTTGEKPIVDYDGFGGQQVRVIEIQKEMPYMKEQIMRADEAIKDNHGHVIDLFMKKIFEHQADLQAKFREYRDEFTNSNSKTANRMGNTFAAIALAGELLEEVFGEIGLETQDHLALTMEFFNESVKDKPVEPRELKALRFLSDWIEENRNNFVRDEDTGRRPFKICGYLQDDYVDIISSVAKEALKRHNFDPLAVKKQWIAWNVLVSSDNGRDYRATYHDEEGNVIRPTVYRINSVEMQKVLEKGTE